MLPKINGKSFLDCVEDDLSLLIDNPDFRENEYIDYKQNFSFLEATDKVDKNKKKSEFKSDVCSYANAEGGYLIYGISDKLGCASEIIGIDIPNNNTDKFELAIRNNLVSIYPRTPNVKFNFVKLNTGKFVVIISVKRDSFAPYTHIEDQKNYQFFKRTGNGKAAMTYAELKNMFNQSLSLSKEIHNYRKERIEYQKSQSETEGDAYSKFMLLHIIPDTFLDTDYNHNMYAIEKSRKISFSSIFKEFNCNTASTTCIDGLRFQQYSTKITPAICYLNNNGIVECFLSLYDVPSFDNNFIPWDYLWGKIETTITEYIQKFKEQKLAERVFVGLSIIGCKGMVSEAASYSTAMPYRGTIDRNLIMCEPIVIEDIANTDGVDLAKKKVYIDFVLSIGVKNNDQLQAYIKEIYG